MRRIGTYHADVDAGLASATLDMAAVALADVQLQLILGPEVSAALVALKLLVGLEARPTSLEPVAVTSGQTTKCVCEGRQ